MTAIAAPTDSGSTDTDTGPRRSLAERLHVKSSTIATVGGFAGFLIVWQVIGMTIFAESRAIPPPTAIVSQIFEDGWAFYGPNIATTVKEATTPREFLETSQVIPLYEEEIEIRKYPVVREEVRVKRLAMQEEATASAEARREELDIEEPEELLRYRKKA